MKPIVLPPSTALRRQLATWKATSGCEAKWRRARRLLDLHDMATFLQGEVDRVSAAQRRLRGPLDELLASELALSPGAEINQRRDKLIALLTSIPASCQSEASSASAAKKLLALSASPRKTHAQRLQVAVELKRLALSRAGLRPNIELRLADWCLDALRDATRAEPAHQQAELNRCLYALYEADPAPYFAKDPALRPPDPPWTVLRADLDALLQRLERSALGKVVSLQRRFDKAFFLRAKAELPSPLDLSRLALPESRRGSPHERTPVVTMSAEGFLVDGLWVPLGERKQLREALRRRIGEDRRGAITVVAAPKAPLKGLFELGRAARRLSVATLLLGVRRQVAKAAPAGDVQARIGGVGRPVWRLEGLPLSIRLLSIHPGEVKRDSPRQLLYDPRSVAARLALTFDPRRGHQLSSRHGVLPLCPPGDRRCLERGITTIRRTYPKESALILAPTHTTTYRRFVALVEQLRFARGKPLFVSLALASYHSIAPPRGDLRQYHRWMRTARVHVQPAGGIPESARDGLRRCYLDALRRAHRSAAAAPQGTIPLWRRGRRQRWPKELKDNDLRSCADLVLGRLPKGYGRGKTVAVELMVPSTSPESPGKTLPGS